MWTVLWISARVLIVGCRAMDMSSDGYPDFGTGLWDTILDRYRCTDIHDRRRCQMYRNHDGCHAHGERVSVKPWVSVAHCWDHTGSAWIEEPIGRRRWCCLFAP